MGTVAAGEGVWARAVVLVGRGIRNREKDTDRMVGVLVRAGAQPVGRASQGSGGTPLARGGGGPGWATWCESPRSPEVMFTERQGSVSPRERVRGTGELQSFREHPGHQVDGT